jgi:hypothetical protein
MAEGLSALDPSAATLAKRGVVETFCFAPLCGGSGKHHDVDGPLCWLWGFGHVASNTAGSGRGPWYLAKNKALSVELCNHTSCSNLGANACSSGSKS